MFFKICLISLIFIFLTPQSNYAEVLKMLKIFGKVLDFNLKDAEIDENCTQTCFSDSDCILAFFNEFSNCQLYFYNSTEFLEVEETNRDDGLFVAFKTNLSTTNPDFCPIESEISPNIFLGEDPILWTNTSDSTWQFKKCVGNWKMFKRSDPEITVCMQVFILGNGTTQTQAKDYCSSMGKQMTGVASVDETKWILKQTQEKSPTTLPDWQGDFTWSDGYTEGSKAFEEKWARISGVDHDGLIQDCLVVSTVPTKEILHDVDCEYGAGIQHGVACGYKLE